MIISNIALCFVLILRFVLLSPEFSTLLHSCAEPKATTDSDGVLSAAPNSPNVQKLRNKQFSPSRNKKNSVQRCGLTGVVILAPNSNTVRKDKLYR